VAVDKSANIYVTGRIYGTSASGYKGVSFGGVTLKSNGIADIFVASFTTGGTHRWSKNWGSSGGDYGSDIATDKNSNVILTGGANSGINFGGGILQSKGNYDIVVASFTSSGSHRWSHAYGDASHDYGTKITTDAQANTLVTGYFEGGTSSSLPSVSFGSVTHKSKGGIDVFLLKLKQ